MSLLHRLDTVCEVVMGQAPDGSTYNTERIGWPLIAGAGDFGDVYPASKKYTASATKLSRKGDIVLGIRASIGDKVWSDGTYCLGRGVAGLRAGPNLNPRYLWHWLGHARQQLAAKGRGATFRQVNSEDIGELQIPVPPLTEQQRIAEVLDCADGLRAKRRTAIAHLDTLTQSIFLDMFGDPVTNPRGWPIAKLGEVGTLDRGVSQYRPRNAPHLLGGAHPLVQTGDVANSGGYIRHHVSTYSDAGLRQSKLWPKGTLCITIAANIGKTGILTFDACFPDSVVGFRAQESATVEFVRVWLSFIQKTLEESAPESAQKNINLAILRSLKVPFPPMALRQAFASRLVMVEQITDAHHRSLTHLDALFASLQHRAFRGEL